MKKEHFCLYLLIAATLLIQACSDSSTNPKNETEVEVSAEVAELQNYLHPINSTSPDSPLDDLTPLANIGQAKVIGLGEATHGTKEFFDMKHKIFRYLVENHNVRVFAFEADMGESIYINRYIQGEQGDVTQLMKTRMHFWTWRTEEVRDLIEWMRNYNQGKPDSEKLHYIGVDSQFLTYQPDLVESYIQEVRPSLLRETQDVMAEIRALGTSQTLMQNYEAMTHDQFRAIRDTINYLVDRMNEFKDEMIANSSHYEFQTHFQLLRNLQQSHTVRYPTDARLVSYRDQFMALNTMWISELLGDDTKIAIWAHNAHVYNKSEALGGYLYNELGDRYKTIGFSFSKGSFIAVNQSSNGDYTGLETHIITADPLPNSINALFHSVDTDNFILNLDEIPGNSILNDYFYSPKNFMMMGSVFNGNPSNYYGSASLRNEYNAIIYVDTTTAAEQLN